MTIQVRPISAARMLEFIEERGSVSFLQTPAWADVKHRWKHELLGFFDGDDLVGAALALYRKLPRIPRWFAYLPEGPLLDWSRPDMARHLDALARYARGRGAFAVRIGPAVGHEMWEASTVRKAIADEGADWLPDVTPDAIDLSGVRLHRALEQRGWRCVESHHGFTQGQPRYRVQVPLRHPDGTARTEDEVLARMHQSWRRNIRKAERCGVTVRHGDRSDLRRFHEIYEETSHRDGFPGRSLDYLERLWDALRTQSPDDVHLYLAEHEGSLLAATLTVSVGGHTWYAYGASSNLKRDVRGSNAVQWTMLREAMAAGHHTYDLRGIVAGLGADVPELGLTRFKLGSGGRVVGQVGEWELPINRVLYRLFRAYLRRRR